MLMPVPPKPPSKPPPVPPTPAPISVVSGSGGPEHLVRADEAVQEVELVGA
jgi:hypothetical protein